MWDKLDRTETLKKGHGRIEKIVFRMLPDTSFIYEKLGLKSFYGTIAKVGIMDKRIEVFKEGTEIKTETRNIFITDMESKGLAMIRSSLDSIPNPKVREKTEEYLKKIQEGQCDFRF